MDRDPLVSILINNYNYGIYLGAAIESALSQTYSPIEVIVVDDGSTDSSRQVIARYAGRVLPVYKENGGQASAFNAGFACSHGDIVIFLDADDLLLPKAAGRVVEAFRADPRTAKVMYQMEVANADGERTGILKPDPHLAVQCGDLRKFILTSPFDLTWMATSGNAFAAKVLRQVMPIPEKVYSRVGADWYLSHIPPLFGHVSFIPEVCAIYRVHGENSYQLSSPQIRLSQIHQTLHYARQTQNYIHYYAEQLGLEGRPEKPEDLLSVSILAQRMISIKLARDEHPIPGENPWQLLWLGVCAARQRRDVSWPLKLLFVAWFAAMSLAPRQVVLPLAEFFSFPEKRGLFNRLLGRLHRTS